MYSGAVRTMVTVPKRWPVPLTSWVSGGWIDQSGAEVDMIHGATGAKIGSFHVATNLVVDEAINAAKAAQSTWATFTGTQRGRILHRAADLLSVPSTNMKLAQLESLDTSRPMSETIVVDIVSARDCLEYFAGAASSLSGEYQPIAANGSFVYTRREPLGVTAGIGAWNYPIQCAAWKSAPALAFGNAMIYKPSEETVLSALALAEVYQEAGLPDGLFQVLLGDGATGKLLTNHPDIAKVSFTGECGTGKSITRAASETLKRVTLELGGKSPLVIFADCDLDDAVSAAMLANFFSNGQVCSNGTRIYVEEKIHDRFLSEFIRRTKLMKVGDPFDPSTQVSSLVSKRHQEKVIRCIERGVAEGARLVCGGESVSGPGAIVVPAIFTDCAPDMSIIKNEIFGPVACVMTFTDVNEVIQRANDTIYGLAAGIFTKDLRRAHQCASKLQAGVVYINNYNLAPVEMPWGGNKQSGVGRENGSEAAHSWTQLKSVYVEMGKVESPYQ